MRAEAAVARPRPPPRSHTRPPPRAAADPKKKKKRGKKRSKSEKRLREAQRSLKGDALLRDYDEGGEFYEAGGDEEGAWEGGDADVQDYYEDVPEAPAQAEMKKGGFFSRMTARVKGGKKGGAGGGGGGAAAAPRFAGRGGGSVQEVDW